MISASPRAAGQAHFSDTMTQSFRKPLNRLLAKAKFP